MSGAVRDRGAIVLAGGGSRRMGEDKAGLRLGDRSLLARVVAELAGAVDEVVVVGHPGQSLPPLADGIARVDDDPAHARGGPLVGLAAGLDHLHALGVAVAYLGSVDTVFLSRAHVDWMLAQLVQGVSAAVPEHEGRLHPLAAAVRVEPALDTARALLADGRRSALALFEDLRAVRITEFPDPRVLRACNTPEEWARLRAEWGA